MNEKKTEHKKNWRRKLPFYIRCVIQMIFFVSYPAAFQSAFSGIKYICTQFGMAQEIEWNSFLQTLIGLLVFTILFGRFFCGYACAFGALGDWVYEITDRVLKKCKIRRAMSVPKRIHLMQKVKYIILALICVTCFTGIYAKQGGWNPWDVFSRLTSLNISLSAYPVGILLFILILVGMAYRERFFCQYLCPMGAVFALLPTLPFLSVHRDRGVCPSACSACTRVCPAALDVQPDMPEGGECISCGKCMDICPKKNMSSLPGRFRGNEWWVIALKAILLYLLLTFLNNF
jgi:polyferredoxin